MSARIKQPRLLSVQLAADEPALNKKAGETIQLTLSPADVNSSEELDTFLAGYRPRGFRADEVSPPFLVDKSRDKYRMFSEDDAFEEAELETSIQGRVRTVDPRSATAEYSVIERALASYIPAATEAESEFDIEKFAGMRVKRVLDINRERRVWTPLTTASNWATANKATPANNWADTVDGDPIKDVQSLIETSAQEVTGIYFNDIAAHTFLRHPKTRDHMRQMLGDSRPQAAVEAASGKVQGSQDFVIPGLPPFKVVTARHKVNGAAQTPILGNFCVLVVAPMDGVPTSGEDIKTIQTFRKRGASGTGVVSRKYFVEDRGLEGGNMLVSGHAEDVVMLADNCGGLLSSIY